jgi:hypothetical protein
MAPPERLQNQNQFKNNERITIVDKEYLESVNLGKGKSGKQQLLRHLDGKRLTRNEAIKAKCYDCDGMGDSGSCDLDKCALFPYSPYKGRPVPKDPAHRAKGQAFYRAVCSENETQEASS